MAKKTRQVVNMLYWYVMFFVAMFFIDFYGINGGFDDPESFPRMAIAIAQVLLQLGAAHYCVTYGGRYLPSKIKYGMAAALLFMALRRMTAFMVMFEVLPKDSLIPLFDKLFIPITISFIFFVCFYSFKENE